MGQRQPKRTKSVVSVQVWDAVVQVAKADLPMCVVGGVEDDSWFWEILPHAAVNGSAIESACNELRHAPSGNCTR